jgi:trehalose 6-phosphate phosphatase
MERYIMSYDPLTKPADPPFWRPDGDRTQALFLDVDGTLIEIAPKPDEVRVDPLLPGLLARLSERLDGALALISGRSIATLDRLLGPTRLPAAGLHGAELRRTGDAPIQRMEPSPALLSFRPILAAAAADWRDVLLEDKDIAIALHYRQAPERASDVRALMERLAAGSGGELEALLGRSMVELRPVGAHKGRALTILMGEPAFAGRAPVMLGDDVTDEDAFAVAAAMGGRGLRVGIAEGRWQGTPDLEGPQAVRAWLATLADRA